METFTIKTKNEKFIQIHYFNFKKSQASLEYITIFAIAFIILAIMAGIFFSYVSSTKQSLDIQQINNLGNEITSNINKIYFLGNGNRLTISGNFPEGIVNLTIHHIKTLSNETFEILNITVIHNGLSISNIYETKDLYVRFNCTLCNHNTIDNISYYNKSDFSPGVKNIRIESKGDWVSVDFINDLS